MLAFGQIQGVFNTLGTVLGLISTDYGYTVDDGSNFGAMFIVGGIIGCVPFGIYCETTRKFKTAVTVICASASLMVFLEYLFFGKKIVWLTYIMTFIQGFVSLPVMAVAFDFGVEITYPVGESFSTGLLMSAGQFFGIIYTVISSELLEHYNDKGGTYSFLFMSVAALIGTIFSFFVKNDLRRFRMEEN